MKKVLYFLVALFLASCAEQELYENIADAPKSNIETDNQYAYLLEQARWGDGQAYLKLANLYHKGQGVQQDFLGTISMLAMADQYGAISNLEDYMKTLPEEDNMKLFFDAMENFERKNMEASAEMTDRLIAQGSPEGYTLKGIMAVEKGDTIDGRRLISLAVEQGSTFAELLLTMLSDWKGGRSPSIEVLVPLADRIPLACKLLGDVYAGIEDKNMTNEDLAAMYYKKADEQACLGKRAAQWLIGYYVRNKIQVGNSEMERLKKLSGFADYTEEEETASNQHADAALEDLVQTFLDNGLEYSNASKAIAYVVETKTGRIKAHVSRERNDKEILPCVDTFENEQMTMCSAATYLAILTTGKVTPEDIVDTECGIYKDVRDHNWRRGGYGEISMEFALTHRSQVAFTKALENAYDGNMGKYREKINLYHNGQSNSLMGILTFYNAVANGGRMVKLVTEGDEVEVIHEQIANQEHIAALQKGLRSGVTDGIFKKAGSELTNIAACGRTYNISDMKRRMEMCGYFPADNPEYTIMVVLEKDGLPASAGGMCGPIMAEIADALLQ